MFFLVKQLIPGQDVVTVPLGARFQDALDVMAHRDFSQIPVTDGQGRYLGLLSEHGIVQHLHSAHHDKRVLDDIIDRWYVEVAPITEDTDVLHLLERLKSTDAVVIVDAQQRPCGVVTHYDAAQFYGTYAYGFMLIEYIERTLRRYLESAYPDREERIALLVRCSPRSAEAETDQTTPQLHYDNFTLLNYRDTIQRNWRSFGRYFGEQKSFESVMRDIPTIRNAAMHFRRDQLEPQQVLALETAANYLSRCERQFPPTPASGQTENAHE